MSSSGQEKQQAPSPAPVAALAPAAPQTMNAIRIHKYGGTDTLKMEAVPIPTIPEDEKDAVLVKVHYTSLNPSDYKIRKGNLTNFFSPAFPLILGQDASGEVVQVGKDVKRFKVGDQVAGMKELKGSTTGFLSASSPLDRSGTYAEYAVFREHQLAKKPAEMSMEEAAAIPTVGLASYQSLIECANVQKGQRVLILGASGGVGSYSVQLAKKVLGAEVYAVCSPLNAEYVKDLGADKTIEYKDKENASGNIPLPPPKVIKVADKDSGLPEEADVVLDLVGGNENRKQFWHLLKKRKGKYVQLAVGEEKVGTWDMMFKYGFLMLSRKVLSWIGFPEYHIVATKPNAEQLEKVFQWHTEHKFKTHFTRNYPGFEYIQTAHKLLESRRVRGKLVLRCTSIAQQAQSTNVLPTSFAATSPKLQ